MTAAAYESMGGLTGAVVERAESLFGALASEARSAARHVFLRLVSVNEAGEDTRRRALLSELQSLERRDGFLDDMLRAFARHRLLSFDRDPASRGPTVEIAHEALIGAWARLSGWIDEVRDDLRAQRRLAAAAAEWTDQDMNPDFLLTGASLGRYAKWNSDPPVRLTLQEQAYLGAALERDRAREQAARNQLLRESQLRRRTRALVGLGAISLLVVLLAVLAFNQGQTARDLAAQLSGISRARQLASDSGHAISEDPDLAILLAIEAIRATESSGEALPEAVDALHWALQAATVEYPAVDLGLPVAVRPSPSGPRGVFVLPPSDLADLGRSAVGRGFSSEECDRIFSPGECSDATEPVRPDLGIAGGIELYEGLVNGEAALAGTQVVVTGGWYDVEADAATEALTALGTNLGIEVVYRGALNDSPQEIAMGDDPGDVIFPHPGAIAEIAAMRTIVDIGAYLGEQYLRDSYGDYLVSLASLDGRSYGVFVKLGAKSLLWYNRDAFEEAGYTQPSTWNELLTLSDQMVLDGNAPWCLGVQSGAATGWPATDWLETIVLRSQGPEFYDQWASHAIPFDHPAAVAALEKVGLLAHTPGYVSPDPAYIRDRSWEESAFLVAQDDPQCRMLPLPDFVVDYFGDAPMAAMPFPTIDPAFTSATEGGGDVAIALSDRPVVRAVIRGLASQSWGESWAQSDVPFIPAHAGFDLAVFADPVHHSIATSVRDAIEAGLYRFDASDQMPIDIAFGPLHSALVDYLTNPGASAEEALSSVEAAWVEYEAGLDG
jgi:alpha-glucoside transport system substrate-binding protein